MTDNKTSARTLREAIEALAHSPEADRWRLDAANGTVGLPYASNRYLHLLDDLRALLAEYPDDQPEGETVTECPHLNVRTFRWTLPNNKCLDCGAVVEKRWTPVTPAGGEG